MHFFYFTLNHFFISREKPHMNACNELELHASGIVSCLPACLCVTGACLVWNFPISLSLNGLYLSTQVFFWEDPY